MLPVAPLSPLQCSSYHRPTLTLPGSHVGSFFASCGLAALVRRWRSQWLLWPGGRQSVYPRLYRDGLGRHLPVPGRGGLRAHVPGHRIRRAGGQPAVHPDGAATCCTHRARRCHRHAAGPGCAHQHRHGAAGARPGICRFQSAGAGPASRRDRHLETRHGRTGGDWPAQAGAVVRGRSGDACTTACGLARFHRRHRAGVDGLVAAAGNATLAGRRFRHPGSAAVCAAGQGPPADEIARRAGGVFDRHRAVLRARLGGTGRARFRRAGVEPAADRAAVAEPRLHRRPAGHGGVLAVAAAVRRIDGGGRHQRQRKRARPATITAPATSCWWKPWPRWWPASAAAWRRPRPTSASPRTSTWARAPVTRC